MDDLKCGTLATLPPEREKKQMERHLSLQCDHVKLDETLILTQECLRRLASEGLLLLCPIMLVLTYKVTGPDSLKTELAQRGLATFPRV